SHCSSLTLRRSLLIVRSLRSKALFSAARSFFATSSSISATPASLCHTASTYDSTYSTKCCLMLVRRQHVIVGQQRLKMVVVEGSEPRPDTVACRFHACSRLHAHDLESIEHECVVDLLNHAARLVLLKHVELDEQERPGGELAHLARRLGDNRCVLGVVQQ